MRVLIRGGGDLASGVAVRLFRSGMQVMVTELGQPLVVRRKVAFAEAVYQGCVTVEGIAACKVVDWEGTSEVNDFIQSNVIPVLVDSTGKSIEVLKPDVVVDGRMLKEIVAPLDINTQLVVGLGPGFTAGENCDAVVETQRGHSLGRVIWQGSSLADTGIPDNVSGFTDSRVLRSPAYGQVIDQAEIGDLLEAGDLIARVSNQPVFAPFKGVLRGIIYPGTTVDKGVKIGDIDPRCDPGLCSTVSDKALAVGGGVLEAILSHKSLRLLL